MPKTFIIEEFGGPEVMQIFIGGYGGLEEQLLYMLTYEGIAW